MIDFTLVVTSIFLGLGLAMDAFSVSLANGLNEPCMKYRKIVLIAGVFAFFQAAMPLIGWLCIHTVVEYFSAFERFIPYIALALLAFIGGKMLYEGIKCETENICNIEGIGFWALMVQGIATSIDALSVGFTIAEYKFIPALVCALIIAVVTFFICFAGVIIGKKIGTKFSGKASIFGGIILILIGLEIFITSLF